MFDFVNELDEIKNCALSFRYINYGGKVAIFQGIKDVIYFDNDKVVLKIKSGEIEVSGSNLQVTEIDNASITIKGTIGSIISAGA